MALSNEERVKLLREALNRINDEVLKEELGRDPHGAELSALPTVFTTEEAEGGPVPAEQSEEKERALSALIREMKLPQKIKLALFGNQTARGILIRDTNRMVPAFVLDNPRLTENEVYEFAKNTQLDEGVLRSIGNNPEWMKNYPMKIAIISNPKVPVDISLRWIKFLKTQDLHKLAKSRNIPQVVRNQCRKLVEVKGPSGG